MTTLHITRGIPSSGKTAWAKKWVSEDPDTRIRVNRDDLRMMSFGRAGKLTHEQESMITSMSRMSVKNALTNGIDVVVDDMHLRPKYIQKWVNLCSVLDVDWEIHEFPITVEEAIARDQGVDRPEANRVGEEVIREIAQKFYPKGRFIPFSPKEKDTSYDSEVKYNGTPGKPDAVIVDIDGTVAKMDGRSPYDYSLVSTDKRNHEVANLVGHLSGSMYIIYVSGRPDSCREDTEEWLRANIWTWLGGVTQDDCLYMRKEEDGRPDTTVKLEIFNKYIRDNYNVRFVLDDRNSVVEMWRNLGLTCLQVDEGNF